MWRLGTMLVRLRLSSTQLSQQQMELIQGLKLLLLTTVRVHISAQCMLLLRARPQRKAMELPLYLQHARKPFNWADVPGAADYDAKCQAQLAEKATASSSSSSSGFCEVEPPLMDNYLSETPERTAQEFESWQDDPAEKARRIWEWWVIRAGGNAPAFVHWPKALRLVALVQPSSAYVERLFSQLKLVIQQIGVMGLEQTIETRVMVRVNKLGNK